MENTTDWTVEKVRRELPLVDLRWYDGRILPCTVRERELAYAEIHPIEFPEVVFECSWAALAYALNHAQAVTIAAGV